MLPVSAVSGLVGVLIVVSVAAFYIWHMTGNAVISGAVEIIGAAAAIIVFAVKRELYENLLTNLLGRLALADVFTGITENNIVDVTGIALYLSIIVVFVFLTIQSIQKRRWS